MTDVQKTADFEFREVGTVVNEPYAKAELAKAMHDFTMAVRNIDGGAVFPLKGSNPLSGTGTANFSGWTDAPLEFISDRDAPFPFHDEQHPGGTVDRAGDAAPG